MRETPRPPLGDQLHLLGAAARRFADAHVALAKAEAAQQARAVGRDAAVSGAGALLLGVGWLLFSLAIGYGLGERLGPALGLLLVAAVHVVAGGLLAGVYGRRLRKDRPDLPVTRRTLQRDRRFFGELARGAAVCE